MTGRGVKQYFRQDNGHPIRSEDVYTMVMLYQYQRKPISAIAKQFSLTSLQVRILIGQRACGSCCG